MKKSDIITHLQSQKLKIDLDTLKTMKKFFKNGYKGCQTCFDTLDKFPFLVEDVEYRKVNNKLPQPGRIVETFIAQVISNTLGLSYKGNGKYVSDLYILQQDGGSGKSDLSLLDIEKKHTTILEIKEPFAYGKSSGFTYDETGKPTEFTSKNNEIKIFFETLFGEGNILQDYNVLQNQGHNDYFTLPKLITGGFDIIISYDENGFLVFMTQDEYKEKFDFKIEVRSCGRNSRKVFTPKKLNIVDGFVLFEKNEVEEIVSRGGKTSKRFKLISQKATFSFSKSQVNEVNGLLKIKLDKVKQHLGEVSIQHCIK